LNVIPPSYHILDLEDHSRMLARIEAAGRTCYKSEHHIKEGSAPGFVSRIIKSGHHSVIEHATISVRFIIDRGVSHELVRHRLAAYSQESTRYANYAKERFGQEITVIRPIFWAKDTPQYQRWESAMLQAEKAYFDLLEQGAKPEMARSVLPNSLKTDIVMTCNLREWRHVLGLRCSQPAHPQIREIMLPLLNELGGLLPEVFGDIREKYREAIGEMAARTAALD
jgi:thymidylate synthase (FAD)